MHRLPFLSSALLLLLVVATPGTAGGPTVHELSGHETFSAGTLESLSLDADGMLRLGPAFLSTPLDVPTAWCALEDGGSLWIGTGNEAHLLRVAQDGKVTRIPTGQGLMVTALAPRAGGGVIAAAFPGGRILEVDPEGKVKTLATVPAEHVWALAADGKGGWVVATGMPGALYAVDAFGAVTKITEIADEHARCLAQDGRAWLVGTAPKGLVLSVRGKDVTVVRDLEEQEVVGLLPLGERGLIVAANADQAGGNAQMLGGLLQQMLNPPETKPGQDAPPRAALQDGHVLWIDPSGALTTLWSEEKVAALALVGDGDGAIVGTYPSGRLVRVAPGHAEALWADLPQAEASVLVGGTQGLSAVVTSNPAVLQRVQREASTGTWTSAPIDAGATARWGSVSVSGTGVKALEWRAGETEEPDAAWSAWKPVEAFDGRAGGTGPTARFLQVRATLQGGLAELRALSVVGAAPNRAPRILALDARRQGEGEASATWDITWKAEDADGDRLQVRLHANRDGSPHWIPLIVDKIPEAPKATWETAGLPDGLYRLRLVVSDAPDTPPERARETVRHSAPLRVDNTAPQVTVRARLVGDRVHVDGEAVDQPGGRITAVRVSVNGGPWRVVSATDGLMDEAREAFEASLESPGAGVHDIVAQARDDQGNLGAGAAVLTIR